MRRTVPELPEVTRGKHQAGAEMMLPDTVHDDARGKRVRGIGDRLRKLEALLAFVEWPRLAGRKDGEEARGRRIAFGVAIASDPDKLLRGVGVLFDDLQKRILRREGLLQPVGPRAQIGQARLPGAGERYRARSFSLYRRMPPPRASPKVSFHSTNLSRGSDSKFAWLKSLRLGLR